MSSTTAQESSDAIKSAVQANDYDEAKRLLNEWSCNDQEPLQEILSVAIQQGNADVTDLLLRRGGFDMSFSNVRDAAWKGSVPIFERLVQHGWDVNENLDHERDALTIALRWHRTSDAARWLLEHGADPNRNGGSGLEIACGRGDTPPDIIRALLKKGARVSGSGALFAAAAENRVEALRLLIEEGGADVNALREEPNVDGWHQDERFGTALDRAAAKGHVESVRFLLSKGASKKIRNGAGRTPEETAVKYGHSQCEAALKE